MGAIRLAVSLAAVLVAFSHASPVPSRLKYDQRQEGKWNVRADLENFIILVIPTTTSGSSATPNASLFDFLSKTIPLPYYKKSKKHNKEHHQEEDGFVPDTEQFIESKTAPYHVDISRTRSHLAKLHPLSEDVKEDIIIARSPSVSLAKSNNDQPSSRSSRSFVISVPMENENVQRHSVKEVASDGKSDGTLRKSIGLSGEAIENGLMMERFSKPVGVFQAKVEKIVRQSGQKQEESNRIEEGGLVGNQKVNDTLWLATFLADTIKNGLIESFKKMNEKLKEQAKREEEEYQREQEAEEEEEVIKKVKGQEIKKETPTKKPVKVEVPKIELEPPRISEKIPETTEQTRPTPKLPYIEQALLEEAANEERKKFETSPVVRKPPIKGIANKEAKKAATTARPSEETYETPKLSPFEQLLLLGAGKEQCGPGQERDSAGICVAIKKS